MRFSLFHLLPSGFVFGLVLTILFCIDAEAQDGIRCLNLEQINLEAYDEFDKSVRAKKIILLGEWHYMSPNSIIQADLLMYLNRTTGLQDLLLEFGHAEAYLINKYLTTGRKKYLKHTFGGAKGYVEYRESLERLYQYNKTRENSEKLVVHGLDLEREPGLTASIIDLVSGMPGKKQYKSLLDSLQIRLDTIGIDRNPMEFLLFLRDRLPASIYEDDEDGKILRNMVFNDATIKYMHQRDGKMLEAFMKLDTTNARYLGQFGTAHTMLDAPNSLATKLASKEKYKDEVLVINMHYLEDDDKDIFKEVSDCAVFMFRIDPENESIGWLHKRQHWFIILRDQEMYEVRK